MPWSTIVEMLVNDFLLPLLAIVTTAALALASFYAKKIVDSVINRNNAQKTQSEMEALDNVTAIKNHIMKDLDAVVEAAVCTNMTIAGKMKEADADGKLDAEEIQELQEIAREIIFKSLPESMKDPEGALLKIMGGMDCVLTIINGLIEKHVLAQKED